MSSNIADQSAVELSMEEINHRVSLNSLPQEIRVNIWNNMIKPRLVPVSVAHFGHVRTYSGTFRHVVKRFKSKVPVPIVLHICKESRAVGLKTYRLCFGSHQKGEKGAFNFCYTAPAKIYFSYELDTVHFIIKDLDISTDAYELVPFKYLDQIDKENIRSLSSSFWSELFKLDPKVISSWKVEQLLNLEEIVLPLGLYNDKGWVNLKLNNGEFEVSGDTGEGECTIKNKLIQAAALRPAFCQKNWSIRFVNHVRFSVMLAAAQSH